MATLECHTEVALRREAWRPVGKHRAVRHQAGKRRVLRYRRVLRRAALLHPERLDPAEGLGRWCSC